MIDTEHRKYMLRCLELARLGEGRCAPNPMVGCVIVHDGKIIGEGYHRKYGEAHAEVHAIASVKDENQLHDSTLYVNLEPCSHYGKTPPCADLIIRKGISRVIVGTTDPNPLVSGNGIRKLKEHGCQVEVNFMREECRELNRRFFTFYEKKRPYIILKWAETKDGFVDINRNKDESGKPTWITDDIARIAVHKQRSREAAILVGTRTALTDNPSLTVREWYGKQPLRIVFDIHHRLPKTLHLFDGKSATLSVTRMVYPEPENNDYLFIEPGESVEKIIGRFYERRIQSLIIEGGPDTLQRFIDLGLWDEAHVYTGNKEFGEGIKAPDFRGEAVMFEKFPGSELSIYRNK